jgi:hypothetical protein
LDVGDIDALSATIRSEPYDPSFDLNHDDVLDGNDRDVWVKQLTKTWFGDANLDREFNSADLVHVFQSGQYEDSVAGNSGWSSGDWNGDGDFNSSDLVRAFQVGGYETGPLAMTTVPESTSLVLWMIGILNFHALYRRRSRP